MVKKQIIWSSRAQQDRLNILEYWADRNKSKNYSTKLNGLFNNAADLISKHPEIGKPTNLQGVRIKIIRDYFMIYRARTQQIEILVIWDSRREPKKLHRILKKGSR